MRRSWADRLAPVLSILVPGITCTLTHAGELFRDDFDGAEVDRCRWDCPEREWALGQTWFVGCPEVQNGAAVFEHHTYNPYDLGGSPENPVAHDSTWSQELFSRMRFPRCAGVEFEARVRVGAPVKRGFIASFFAYIDKKMGYGRQWMWSDEIDFEFLSNQVDEPPEPTSHRVWLATWNDFGAPGSDYYDGIHHWATNPVVTGLNLTEWNIFRFRWYPDRVDWYWDPTPDDPSDADKLIYATSNAVPNEPMPVRFNFWSCRQGWVEACDPSVAPAPDPDHDVVDYYYVDYVVVRSIPGSCKHETKGDLDCNGSVDLDDYTSLTACLGAPCPEPGCNPSRYPQNCCTLGDFDADGDVDLKDIAAFERGFGTTVFRNVTATIPACSETLPRSSRNFILLDFDGDLTQPPPGAIEIRQLLPGGFLGDVDFSSSFGFTIEPGNRRRLRIQETGAVFVNSQWYGVVHTGGWAGVEPFKLDLCVLVGDVNNDSAVTDADLPPDICVPEPECRCGARADLDGNGFCDAFDVNTINAQLGTVAYARPSGHSCDP